MTRSFVSLKVNELLLFLSAIRNFFFRNLVHGKLNDCEVLESHLQVVFCLPTQTLHQDDAVGDCCYPSVSRLLVVSNLRFKCRFELENGDYQVNWWHVTVIVEDNGEGHIFGHLGQPGGVKVETFVSEWNDLLVCKPRVALDLVEDVRLEAFSHLVDIPDLVLVRSFNDYTSANL